MRKLLIAILYFGIYSDCLFAQSGSTAWYIEETIDSVLTYGRYKHNFYPIEGFETDETGRLWMLVASGEFTVIHENVEMIKRDNKRKWHEVKKFNNLINLLGWSKDNYDHYLNAKVLYRIEDEFIDVRIITSKAIEEYRYTSLICGNSRFSTIREIKGFLFDFIK